jgi:hypothetical protein
MADHSIPKHDGLQPGMLSDDCKAVLAVVLLTSDGVCVSVPTKIQQQIGPAQTEKMMDAIAEAACRFIVTVN